MKKNLIVAFYFILFWIILPLTLVTASEWIDVRWFPDERVSKSLSPLGWILIFTGFIALGTAVFQFKKFSGVFPVSALPPDRLIEKGVFAVWRHPIYLFACLIFSGMPFALRSVGFLVIILPITLISVGIYIWIEELYLVKRFGRSYALYKKRVPLLFPEFINLVRVFAAPFFHFWFRIKIQHPENIPDCSPYFVVSAHRNYFDPFFISYALPHPIKHICTFEMFRSRMKSSIFRLLGAIPKKRYKMDLQSNRQLIQALNNGYSIGIFPEGGRSWTGEMRSLKPETLLLLRHYSHIPILPVRLEGNYYSWPRWSDHLFKADLIVNFGESFHLNPEMEINEMDLLLQEKIHARSEVERSMICRTKNRIGRLSMVLYRCPCCTVFEALKEIPPDKLLCNSCNKLFVLQPDLNLNYISGDESRTESIHSIYRKIKIQENDLSKLPEYQTKTANLSFLSAREMLLYKSKGQYWNEKDLLFRITMTGEVHLTTLRIVIVSGEHFFALDLNDIDAVTIESNKKLQIYQEKTDVLIQLIFESSSALLWQDLLVFILDQTFHKKVITR